MRYFVIAFLLLFVSSFLIIHQYYQDKDKTVFTIGSGSDKAAYYPTALSLCKIYNKYRENKNFICKAKISKGGQYNLNSIENGIFDMGISQASLQRDAYFGKRLFRGKPHKNIRSLLRLHNEYFTIIAKKGSGIKEFSDIYNRSVNIGNEGSGSRFLFLKIMKFIGWELSDFKEVFNESASDIDRVLCGNKQLADVAVHKIGHPNKSFARILEECDTYLVDVSDDTINSFTNTSSKFWKSEIPKAYYPQLTRNIKTFSSKAMLSVSKDLDYKIVEDFTHTILSHKDELMRMRPALSTLEYLTKDNLDLAPNF